MDRLLKYFDIDNVPDSCDGLGVVVQVDRTARTAQDELPPSAETTAGLRKLLEARDCFVRASLTEKE